MDMSMAMSSSTVAMDMGASSTSSAMPMSSTGSVNTTNLPLSDPMCNSDTCSAYKAAHAASQAQISWASQFLYGHYTTYYYCIFTFIFGLMYLSRRLNSCYVVYPERKTTIIQKMKAVRRSLTYRKLGIGMSFGVAAFIGLAVLFVTIMTFTQRPYYRLHRGFGSPPLAVRTGLMAVALTPIIVALSGKYNLVTLITGISHERLNVFHRYAGYMCLGLSVVHTIPFIVAPLKDGGYAGLHTQFYQPGGYEYTGVPPLALLVFLCACSIPWIRHRFYEAFAHSHIAAYIVYLGLMFWHAGMELDSWNYLWATLGISLFSLFGRVIVKLRAPGIQGAEALLEGIDGEILKMTIPAFPGLHWSPGQHVFLRFPIIAPLDNHPFTIANVCDETYVTDKNSRTSRPPLMFLVKPRHGITKKLMKIAENQGTPSKTIKTFIEGPYGGLSQELQRCFESIILVAGGSGISAVLPLLSSLSRKVGGDGSVLKQINLVWAVKNRHSISWIEEQLNEAIEVAPIGSVIIDYYVTSENATGETSSLRIDEIEALMQVVGVEEKSVQVHDKGHGFGRGGFGRPVLSEVIPSSLRFERTCVIGCGPKSMNQDVSNAVAACQFKVLSGEVQEVALHTETFGW